MKQKNMITKTETKKRHGKINERVLVNAIVAGKSKQEAGRLAGSKAINAAEVVNEKIRDNPELKQKIVDRYRKLEDKILTALEGDDLESEKFRDKTVSLGIVRDKIQLLSNEATERIQEMPKMVITEVTTRTIVKNEAGEIISDTNEETTQEDNQQNA